MQDQLNLDGMNGIQTPPVRVVRSKTPSMNNLDKQPPSLLIAKNNLYPIARRTQLIDVDSIQLYFHLYSRRGSSDFIFRGEYVAGVIDSGGNVYSKTAIAYQWREIAPGVRAKRRKTDDEEITVVEVSREACPLSLLIKSVAGYRSDFRAVHEDTCEEYLIDLLKSNEVRQSSSDLPKN